jgi:hypothetical protein
MSVINQLESARRAGVPLVWISTPDPHDLVERIRVAEAAADDGTVDNGTADDGTVERPLLAWDCLRGFTALNDAGTAAKSAIDPSEPVEDFTTACQQAARLPDDTLVVGIFANRFLDSPAAFTALWLLRDIFKSSGRTLVMIGPDVTIPAELVHDVMMLREDLPTSDQLADIVNGMVADNELTVDDDTISKTVDAVTGLAAFAAEGVVAMAADIDAGTIDASAAWSQKRELIASTAGITIHDGSENRASVGGLTTLLDFLERYGRGKNAPRAVVFVDEIEKQLAGMSGDTSGVSQDQGGQLLEYLQDSDANGVLLVGHPGTGKSLTAKAVGRSLDVPTMRLDLNSCKSRFVGDSGSATRRMLEVVDSVSGGKSLWVATCNRLDALPPELRSRFRLGTWFVDLPDHAEREQIWSIHTAAFGIDADVVALANVSDGWTGREIHACCEIAAAIGCDIREASAYVTHYHLSDSASLMRLRESATGRFLATSYPGTYQLPDATASNGKPKRRRRVTS